MPLYYYEAFSRSGEPKTGVIDASSIQNAKELIRGQGLIPSEISLSQKSGFIGAIKSLFAPRIEIKTVMLFTRQLAVLLRSGVPLLQAFELLSEQFEQPFFGILVSIKEGIKSGESLASQLARYPHVFSTVYIQLVRAGEATGKLDKILVRLNEYMARSEDTRKKIATALRQPKIYGGMLVAITIFLVSFVIPRISGMFASLKKEMPPATVFLMGVSQFVLAHYVLLAGGALLSAIVFMRWKSSENGQYALDRLALRLPVISYFAQTRAVVQFTQTFGMLIESGVNLAEALDIVCSLIDNKVLAIKISQARDNIIKEGKIARSLKETGIFPSIALYMISTGEESGKLGEMLLTVGKDYDEELHELTESLTGFIDPLMKLLIAGVILFIVAAIMLPIMDMGDVS